MDGVWADEQGVGVAVVEGDVIAVVLEVDQVIGRSVEAERSVRVEVLLL